MTLSSTLWGMRQLLRGRNFLSRGPYIPFSAKVLTGIEPVCTDLQSATSTTRSQYRIGAANYSAPASGVKAAGANASARHSFIPMLARRTGRLSSHPTLAARNMFHSV